MGAMCLLKVSSPRGRGTKRSATFDSAEWRLSSIVAMTAMAVAAMHKAAATGFPFCPFLFFGFAGGCFIQATGCCASRVRFVQLGLALHDFNDRAQAARIWSAVTCYRFCRFGDLSPKQGRVQRPGRFGRLPRFHGDKSPAESADKSAHSKVVAVSPRGQSASAQV